MEPYRGHCIKCNKDNRIINNSRSICIDCVYTMNHGGKNKKQVMLERESNKPKVNIKKATGELEIFKKIWAEEVHYCKECNKFLGNELKPIFFSHRKSKGAYPELRLDKNNIDLLCPDCHHQWEFGDRTKMHIWKNI